MALAMTTLGDRFIDIITQDTDADESPVNDITGKAGSVYYVKVVNAWSSSSVYFKLYDSTSATHGTTHPILVMRVAASTTEYFIVPDGMAFTNGLSYCVTDGAGTGSVNDSGPPTNDVTVRMVIS
jgi:hypothetical protein